jgi:hypothetical protein
MSTKGKKRVPKSVAQLIAYDAEGKKVLQRNMSLEKFYEGLDELIDSNDYRRERGIVRVSGKLYDSRGVLVQDFENQYGTDGKYRRGRAQFENGTVQED